MTSSSASSTRAAAVPTLALHNGFGAAHLAKLGWTHGQGLGKSNQGMTTHIRVSRKVDKGGIASKKEDFGFQWWDHLYNKSAVSVTLDKEEESDEESEVEAEVVPEVKQVDPLLAMFVKSDRASEEMDPLDKNKSKSKGKREAKKAQAEKDNYCIPLTDAELLAVCGGRTAAKGARFDYSSSGKVARADTELGKKLAELGVAASASSSSSSSLLPTPSPSPSQTPMLLKGDVPVAEAPKDDACSDGKEGKKKDKKKRSRHEEGDDESRRLRKRAKKEDKRNREAAKAKKEKKSKKP